MLLLKHNQLRMKSILLDKIWFNHIILHSRCVYGDLWLMSLLSSACLPSGSSFALHANMDQFFIHPLILLLLYCTSVFYTTNLKLLITVSSRQNKPLCFCLFLTPSYYLIWTFCFFCSSLSLAVLRGRWAPWSHSERDWLVVGSARPVP